jgi:hypothetical protein
MLGPHRSCDAAHPHLVEGRSVAAASASEYLARGGKVAEDDAVERKDADAVSPSLWSESCGYCLSSHWPILAGVVDWRQEE